MITPLINVVTIADWIVAYEPQEALEITNLCDELATTINEPKLQSAIDRAHDLVNARFFIAGDCGRALIKTSARQLILWISRYILDTTKARPFVDEDYKRAMEYLDYACTECVDRCPLSVAEVESILGAGVSTKSRLRCSSGYTCNNRFDYIPKPVLLDNNWSRNDVY